jgi:uncharacterized protein YdaU (DUF1376 family)
MKPNAYMPFFGKDFFLAIDGYPELVGLAYLRAIWVYWADTACTGLRNDSEFLRRLCHVDRDDWEEVFEIVFDNDKFFYLGGEDGKWHQNRAWEEYQTTKAKYDAVVKGGKNRWKNHRRR